MEWMGQSVVVNGRVVVVRLGDSKSLGCKGNRPERSEPVAW